ncbi:hypothetical protein EG329_003708 [Mollisiaceae sp. DMI_Dod_QoI]|nr:hypothetical protein EG329_003708 [Helotiales sp. DMI_Dod_QoI]
MSREESTPSQTQNENSRSHQASVEDEVGEEVSRQEQSNVPNGTHNRNDIPPADSVEYGAGNEIRAFVRAEEDTRREVMPANQKTEQIRLVLLGRAEARKSSLRKRQGSVMIERGFTTYRLGKHMREIRELWCMTLEVLSINFPSLLLLVSKLAAPTQAPIALGSANSPEISEHPEQLT